MHERHIRLAGLETCLIEGSGATRLRVIFLHGYNMRASDLIPFAHSLAIPGVGYVFPQAPTAVSETGYAWWPSVCPRPQGPDTPRDLWQNYPAGREFARASIRNLLGCIREDFDGPLMLAGFSQGGMLACDSVLMGNVDVAALAMMSASCIATTEWYEHRQRLAGVSAFVSHGRADPDLSLGAGLRLVTFLGTNGAAVTWMPFDGGHEIPFVVWKQFKRFVQATLRAGDEAIPDAHETH